MFRVFAICQVNFRCKFEAVRHSVHVTMEMGIQIFRAVTLCCWVCGFIIFRMKNSFGQLNP